MVYHVCLENLFEDGPPLQVLAVTPATEEQAAWLLALRAHSSLPCPPLLAPSPAFPAASAPPTDLDWWSEPGKLHTPVLVNVPPRCLASMEEMVREEGISYNVTIRDLEQMIREERSYRYYVNSFHWHSQV